MSPRATGASVLAAWRATTSNMLSLVEVATAHAGTPFIRRTTWDHDVTFGSLTFTATPVQYGKIQVDRHDEQGGITLKLPDVDGSIAALVLLSYTFRETRVRFWVTDLVATGGAGTDGILSVFYVESVECEDGAVTFHLRSSFAIFDAQLPRGTMTRTEFPGLPSDSGV